MHFPKVHPTTRVSRRESGAAQSESPENDRPGGWLAFDPRPSARFSWRTVACVLAASLLGMLFLPGQTDAQDTVIVATGKAREGRMKRRGQITDYTGAGLVLVPKHGRKVTIPVDRIVKIETQRSAEQVAGDQAMAQDDYYQALTHYDKAAKEEKRRWVRREIIAAAVRAHRALGHLEKAGDLFLVLAEEDPATPYFDVIPLAWTFTRGVSRQKAKSWLAKKTSSAAMLLGASWLLSGIDRPAAVGALNRLRGDPDRRIALLSMAQSWRTRLATASQHDLVDWGGAIERLPESLRAGPYFVLGRALAHRKKSKQAALMLLRVPILHPHERDLAAESLLAAASVLEQSNHADQAGRLFEELIRDYPKTTAAEAAKQRLKELQKEAGNEQN